VYLVFPSIRVPCNNYSISFQPVPAAATFKSSNLDQLVDYSTHFVTFAVPCSKHLTYSYLNESSRAYFICKFEVYLPIKFYITNILWKTVLYSSDHSISEITFWWNGSRQNFDFQIALDRKTGR